MPIIDPTSRCLITKKVCKDETSVILEFNVVLHRRGSDWWIYRNMWDGNSCSTVRGTMESVFRPEDGDLLYEVVRAVMADDVGVYAINVYSYKMVLWVSRAIPEPEKVIREILEKLGDRLGIT